MSEDEPDRKASTSRRRREPRSVPDGYNAGYAERLYERALRSRGLVPPSLAEWVENGGGPTATGDVAGRRDDARRPAAAPEAPARETVAARLRVAAAAAALVEAYRDHGHLEARLDPLGAEPLGHPFLKLDFHGVSEEELARVPAAALNLERLGDSVADVLARLRETYCGRIGYELDHVENPAERDWLTDYIESGRHGRPLAEEDARALLERLSEVEGLERFLHRAYLGKKRFSIEGLDMMVPMLDRLLRLAADAGTREVVLGMAHRGRLNVLAHIIGRPYEAIVAEFEGIPHRGVAQWVPEDGAGDVKYHLGAAGKVETAAGELDIYLAPNPSHLEHVNPVVEGMARAARTLRLRGERGGDGGPRAASRAPRGEPQGRGSREPDRPGRRGRENPVLPVLIHGDAGFMGQGVVAETLNMCRLEGYETGGTVHFIANNQLGFTTDPRHGRSTRYASDLALGYRIPILHVNADAPGACLAAVSLALDYRREFGQDIVIDLIGYRRHGHNEGDEPAYTQPDMYGKIEEHPSVRTQWAGRLAERGIVSGDAAERMADRVADRLHEARDAHAGEKSGKEEPETGAEPAPGDEDGSEPPPGDDDGPEPAPGGEADPTDVAGEDGATGETRLRPELTGADEEAAVETGVDASRLEELNRQLHAWPEDFDVVEKLARQMRKRGESLEEGEPLDWAHGEALAFASLVTGGVAVRLTGEDTVRGTFSQRHLTLHEVAGDRTYTPLQNLESAEAPFVVWNSPLSEVATLGFEYGYSTIATDSLVLWEAQFGDFVNVGQAIIDQFIVSGRSKWGQESRLVLLLPHAYEGQGPEHSSARLERFLQLAAGGNIRVANPTTPAQYFHLLRLQALRPARRPLVVMTPKSLLRHAAARSSVDELAGGRFRPVLPEPRADAPDPERVTRALLCSGKVYYDLAGSDARQAPDAEDGGDEGDEADGARRPGADDGDPPAAAARTAILRLERLHPFPREELRSALEEYPNLQEIRWVQEEPANMGVWQYARPRLREVAAEIDGEAAAPILRYVGRPESASPAEGYPEAHRREQERIVTEAFRDES